MLTVGVNPDGTEKKINNTENDSRDQVVCDVVLPSPDARNSYLSKSIVDKTDDFATLVSTTNIHDCIVNQVPVIKGLEEYGVFDGKQLMGKSSVKEFGDIARDTYSFIMDERYHGEIAGLTAGEENASE